MNTRNEYTINLIGDRPVRVQEGQSVLRASLAAGIPHYHVCGGQGKCSTCRILVQEGEELLSSPTRRELELREKMSFPAGIRLACQTKVKGEPVSVQRIIRDDDDLCLYVGTETTEGIKKIGEERELALFFLDIRNFTPFMEFHSPFDVMHMLRRLFRLFQKEIEENSRGKILETGGDSLYAVFGLEEKLPIATQAAVETGLKILEDVKMLNEGYLKPYFNYRAEVGIGLHVGRVIVGNTGLGLNRNLAVMGLPVNIAARLQSATRQLNNSFVVSADAWKLTNPQPLEPPKATIKLKGVQAELDIVMLGKPYE
ncbi:adenylate/guanylate cyclase domain-containing protein [Pontibacter korlensis]|uniref:adenylate/guanylate cyclase domain-containing protein n=1 Tax=Pontibacter korlensis TaxID=400092 RepID=UPI000A757B1C|nr:adenylate/guanylate cyclase domain-containing protein [Pontibacter korlensis]